MRQMSVPGGVGEKLGRLELSSAGSEATPQQMSREIAFDIDRYLTSGRPTEDVWTDLDDLREWERLHWPRT